MKPDIGINEKDTESVVKILILNLANEYVLYTKTRNYHWNVTGPSFHELHKFFESQYEELDQVIDQVAERIRSVGSFSPGSMKVFLETTTLKEEFESAVPAEKMIAHLLKDHETIIKKLREDVKTTGEKTGDFGTCDFLTGIMEQHEKMAWMLRAYIK